MDYNENIWEQGFVEKHRIKDGISVSDIINLYLDRCREAKDIYDREVRIYRPFEARLCEIINDSMKEYFDGKVDTSNIYKVRSLYNLRNQVQRNSLNFATGFDEYNRITVVDLENIWKKDNMDWKSFLPSVFIDKDFNVYIPNKSIRDMNSNIFDDIDLHSAIDDKVCEVLNQKQELLVLKEKSDKYSSLEYEDKINKRKEELLMSVDGISVKLDNDITLRFSMDEKDFLESKFKREKVKVEAYDKNNKFLWSNNNGFNYASDDSNSIKKDYKKILEFVSSDSCVWKLRAPFDSSRQIIANKEVRDKIDRERKIDLAISKALKEKNENEKRLEELKSDNEYYLESYQNTSKLIEEYTGKVNNNRISGMDEDMLFDKDNKGILHVKDKYKGKLDLFDLSLIKWDNVDVRGINFTGCNVNIDPQKVHDKDLSNITFISKTEDGSDFIFSEFSEFSKVNLSGAVIKCKNKILNISNSIMDDNTEIEVNNIIKDREKEAYKNKKNISAEKDKNDYETISLFDDIDDYIPEEKVDDEILDNYRSKYGIKKDDITKQEALNTIAKYIVDGVIDDEDIYALLSNKKKDNLNKRM